MIQYIGMSPGAQVTRGYWRVTLKEGFDILGKGWATKVELWRAAVDAGAADIPAVTSPAAVSPDPVFGSGRAVVDVHVLGALQGDSVSALADRLDTLTRGVDVVSVQLIPNSDAVGRAGTLTQAVEDAKAADPIEKLTRLFGRIATLAIILGVVYVGVGFYRQSRK